MKIVMGIVEVSPPPPSPPDLHILFHLFDIPLLIYSWHSSQVICKMLRLLYSDPLYHSTIAIKNVGKCL